MCVAFLAAVDILGQISRDSLVHSPESFQSSSISTTLDKQLNIYSLKSNVNYNLNLNNLFLGFKEDFKSTIINSFNKNIKDEHYFSLLGEYSFRPYLKFGITFNNDIYSDNRSLAINQVSVTQATFYTRVVPFPRFNVIPFAGISNNKQIGEIDNGYIYGAEFGIDSLEISDFTLNTTARFSNEDISPRRSLNRSFRLNLSNQFENTLMNEVSASYSEQRRDFYLHADSLIASMFNINNNIQSRTETNYYIQDQLILIPERSNILVTFFGRLDWRKIDRETRYVSLQNLTTNSFDTNIEEFKIQFATNARYYYKNFTALFNISFIEREEKHSAKDILEASEIFFEKRRDLEFQKNNKSLQTSLSVLSTLKLSPNDYLSLSLFHRKMEYDTPSENNYDDRDELLSILGFEYRRKVNSLMDVFLQLDGSLNHVVYIYGERSSNNNIRRVLKLTSGTTFHGKRFRTTTSASVMADYTVFDFVDFNPFLKNYSFRRFSVNDSTFIKIDEKFSFTLDGYIMLSEQGDFSWKDFSNNPSRFLQEIYAEPVINYKLSDILLGLGVRFFTLNTYGYEDTKKVEQSAYNSLGPLVRINIDLGSSLFVSLNGWYEFIKMSGNERRELANFTLRMNWVM